MPGQIGITEIIVVLVIVLLIFGPKRVPELGRSIGKGLREFKNAVTGESDDDKPKLAQPASHQVDGTVAEEDNTGAATPAQQAKAEQTQAEPTTSSE